MKIQSSMKYLTCILSVLLSLGNISCASNLDGSVHLSSDNTIRYVTADSPNVFGIYSEITREEFATMVYAILDKDYRTSLSEITISYHDVGNNTDKLDEIIAMSNAGIMLGYADNTFRPNNILTRGEIVNVLSRIKPIPKDFKPRRTFLDIQDVYNRDAIEYAATMRWISGYCDNNFKPDKPVTKIETIVIMNRFLGREWDSNTYRSSDLLYNDVDKNAWYYKDLLLALGNISYVDEIMK